MRSPSSGCTAGKGPDRLKMRGKTLGVPSGKCTTTNTAAGESPGSRIDFRSYKKTTILRRLKRRLVATGCGDIEEYRGYLDEHPEEYRQLVSSFLIKVTEFFRDPELYEYLKEDVLPGLVEDARKNGRQLRIWSAGCATEEEAYSLAMLVSEVLGDEAGLFDVRIFATDLDEESINFARQGVYPESSLGGLSEEQIQRYFIKEDGQYQVKKAVRAMIVFGEHDLARRSPFPRIDLCVSRNVLIYFTPELQRRALQLFAYSLRDGGALVLGKAETTSTLSDYFEPADRRYKVYRRRGVRFLMPPLPAAQSPMPPRTGTHHGPPPEDMLVPGGADPQQRMEAPKKPRGTDEGFLDRLPVGAVVVDRRYDMRAINAPARRLLSIHGVVTGEDFLHTLRGAPYAEVRAAIDAAFRGGGPASTGEFVAEEPTGEQRYLRLDCYPWWTEGEAGPAETVMVTVHDVTQDAAARRDLEERLQTTTTELERTRREAEAGVARLKLQNTRLVETNRNLEEAVRELTDLNGELQESYEGALLQSEESQAATEEVETLNEELQATNEELETLNEELQATIEELNTTNDDLQARTGELQETVQDREKERRENEAARARLNTILEQATTPVALYEGPDLVFRFVNGALLSLFNRREEDVVGKTFAEAFPELDRQGRAEDLRRVYDTGKPSSGRVENEPYDWNGDGVPEELFLDVVRLPLHDANGDVEGVLSQMADVTEKVLAHRRAKELEDRLREERSHLEEVLGLLGSDGEAVLAVDAEGNVLFGNEAFQEAFGASGQSQDGADGRASFNGVLLDGDGESLPAEAAPLSRATRGEVFSMRFALDGEDGTRRAFEAEGRPLDPAGGLIIFRDAPTEPSSKSQA